MGGEIGDSTGTGAVRMSDVGHGLLWKQSLPAKSVCLQQLLVVDGQTLPRSSVGRAAS